MIGLRSRITRKLKLDETQGAQFSSLYDTAIEYKRSMINSGKWLLNETMLSQGVDKESLKSTLEKTMQDHSEQTEALISQFSDFYNLLSQDQRYRVKHYVGKMHAHCHH